MLRNLDSQISFRSKVLFVIFLVWRGHSRTQVVERKRQHLLNVTRALLFQSGVSLGYWGDGVLTATHLINRLPFPLLKLRAPFENLHSKVLNYRHLRTFSCLCDASTLPSSRHKFTPKSKACILLGYRPGIKAYKLLDIELGRNFYFLEMLCSMRPKFSSLRNHLQKTYLNFYQKTMLPLPYNLNSSCQFDHHVSDQNGPSSEPIDDHNLVYHPNHHGLDKNSSSNEPVVPTLKGPYLGIVYSLVIH
ncbi:Retrovirus-related Pol polyprotein from transposon TNT 1-94 [Abeliophyllum distichum]|uniref:Retrovirus-related Pol polyprotein from transposon TNT 1-94 n=1 Tax=Abeliophyllum distichum TaxID=126358 RepID=A0ABD1V4M1_9LAMI